MKTFLFANSNGCWLGIAQRVKAEGHKIYFFMPADPLKGSSNVGKGIFTKDELIDDYHDVLLNTPQDDLYILWDDNGHGKENDFLRACGFKVLGSGSFGDDVEYDRMKGTKLMQRIGLPTPETIEFNNLDLGITFLKKQDKDARFVFKPHGGNLAGGEKTYLGKNTQDLIQFIEWVKQDQKAKHYELDKFELQTFIDGIEADFSGYFDGEKFMPGSFSWYFEQKKIGNDNTGQAAGCAGAALFFVQNSPYYEKYLKKLEPILKAEGQQVQIAINNIFSKKDGLPYGLEFTPRLGWDSFPLECMIHQTSGQKLSDLFIAILDRKPYKFNSKLISYGARISTGSPTLKKDDVQGRYFTMPQEVEKNMWFFAVSKQSKSYMVEDNPIGVMACANKNLQKAVDQTHDYIKQINLPDTYYRSDTHKRVPETVQFLKSKGWL